MHTIPTQTGRALTFVLVPMISLFPISELNFIQDKDMLTVVNLFGELSLMKSFFFVSLQLWQRWIFVMHKCTNNYSDWPCITVKLNVPYNFSVFITSWWSHEAGPRVLMSIHICLEYPLCGLFPSFPLPLSGLGFFQEAFPDSVCAQYVADSLSTHHSLCTQATPTPQQPLVQ